jgi:LuxR family maltose regulon positive regulatory protein
MLLLQSWIELAEGNPRAANAALLEAIDIGARQGFMLPFLFVGAEVTAQLQEISRTSAHAAYIRRLLEAIRRGQVDEAGSGALANPLSRRQTEIMRLVAAGYSNRDIADQLFISEQTVKKHLGNTFLRLDASNRTQAVDISRRLNVI